MEKQFQNEHVSVAVEKKKGCRVLFKITVSPVSTQAARSAAARKVGKEINIPGFRKGKAPQGMIEQKYQPYIDREFKEILAQNAFQEAIKLTQIGPFSYDADLKMSKCEPLNDGNYFVSIEFDAFPDVPKVEKEKINVQKPETKPVTEKQIEERIWQLQLHHAEWDEVKDRAAQEGDFVIVDIDVLDDEKGPLNVHQDSRFCLKEGKIPDWAKKLLVGLNEGESKEGFSEPTTEEQSENFTPKKCLITLKKIQSANLPPLDDALAKKAGVETVEALRKAIVKSVSREEEQNSRNAMRQEVKTQLSTLYPFELPESRVKRLHEECHQLAEQEAAHLPHDQKHDYAHKLLEEAEQTVRLSYLLPKVLKDFNLPFPTQTEIQTRTREHILMRYMSGQGDLSDKDVQQMMRIAESELLSERALDFLLEKA